ncbi:DinB family protein [Gemmatimonas groenlandica]|uniref:DinB family protein n=1 Tax=Gemmatimonas groenlandica TaxID=2732249 RepID=A0A6M4ISA6_9BACT|nr:DinB family protein [Gemmatimonas groenlandica]QJR36948.1 DinB family protein [Gemmatimonas groenlandica]
MDFDLTHGSAILARTPTTLHAWLDGLDTAWTSVNEGPDTWSAYDIVGHLLHGEKTDWIPRAQLILAQGDDRRFSPFDRFAQFEASQGRSLAELLRAFTTQREASLATLCSWQLSDSQLALRGEHPAFGEVTLRQLLATWVAHDLGHLAQIARVMAKQYRAAVGPWREYLPILDRG